MATRTLIHAIASPRTPPQWGDLRAVDARARKHAIEALPLIRAAMGGHKATLACFHIATGKRAGCRATMWRRRSDGAYDVAAGIAPVSRDVLDEICAGLTTAAREIAGLWPDRARPAVVGFGTDGHKIVFNPGHPSCEGAGWLAEHLSGASPASVVADDGEEGFLSIITTNEGMQ